MKALLQSLGILALLACGPAFAAVAVVGTPVQGSTSAAGTINTFTYTVPAGSNVLVVLEGAGLFAGGSNPSTPSSVTYNGVSLTMVAGSAVARNFTEASVWYLVSPPTGVADTYVITYPSSVDTSAITLLGLSGVNTGSPVGTPAVATGTGTAPSATATGGVSGDLYLAALLGGVEGGTITAGGGQSSLGTFNPRGSFSASADSIAGSSPGAFSWTFSVSQDGWAVSAVAFKSGAASSCTHDGYVRGTGAKTVPTAGSTLVYLQSGNVGTVDCSTVPYWQIPGGVFGVN